jgi:nitrate reductase NapAB chaperone NapD
MATPLTEQDGRTALRDHVVRKAIEARDRHGVPDHDGIVRLLDDRTVVRYPVELCFDAGPLEPREFAWPMPLGDQPGDGFRLCLHPCFKAYPEASVRRDAPGDRGGRILPARVRARGRSAVGGNVMLVGAVARVVPGANEDVRRRLERLEGVESPPDERPGMVGVVIEADDPGAAHRILTEDVAATEGVLAVWPVSAWYDESPGECHGVNTA